jgi:hypothetical protein
MGMPIIPYKNREQALTDILESIALEEMGIAHLLNSEGEKVEVVAELMKERRISPFEAIKVQKTVSKVIQSAIKMQMLLQFKLEEALEYRREVREESEGEKQIPES